MALARRAIGPRAAVGTIVAPTGMPGSAGVNQPPLTWGSLSGTIASQADLVTFVEEQPTRVTVGAAEPATPVMGQLWYDATNNRLMLYIGTWFQIA